METNELLQQKRAAVECALNRKEGAFVPNIVTSTTATVAWAGKKTTEIIDNPAEYIEALTAVFEHMWVDLNMCCGAMIGNKMEQAFPTLENKYGPDGNTLEHVQLSPMKKDEYSQLIEDPARYIANVLLPRKYPDFYADRESAKKSLKLFVEDKNYAMLGLFGMATQVIVEKYGIVSDLVNVQDMITVPLDMLFDYFRGFRGTLTDLRRQPENVKAAIEALWNYRVAGKMAVPFSAPNTLAMQVPHIPAYLSPKQFEELYWPHQKKQIERIAAGGGKAYIVLEGRWEKIWHHFLELPKDSCVLTIDDDDFLKAYAELGHHHILCGGLKAADTRLKTFNQIKDDVKRVLDTCAPGGGFLFATDKYWIAPGDVNQTLIDAYNFAHEYTSK